MNAYQTEQLMNIDYLKKKKNLEYQISILEWILKDHATLKVVVVINGCWKFSFASHESITLNKILKQKTVILNCKNISQLYYMF